MSDITYDKRISLDLNVQNSYVVVGAKQSDSGRRIIIDILRDGIAWTDMPAWYSVSYRVRKPDGTAGWVNATNLGGGVIQCDLTSQTLAASGRAYMDIMIQNPSAEGQPFNSTTSFILYIQAMPDVASKIISSNEFIAVQEILNEAEDIIHESQAWAEGKRDTVPVTDDSHTQSIVGIVGSEYITYDWDIFKSSIDDPTPGETGTYIFTYSGTNWLYNEEIVTDMATQYGITIPSSAIIYTGATITINFTFADSQYNNHAKYWAGQAQTIKTETAAIRDATTVIKQETAQIKADTLVIKQETIEAAEEVIEEGEAWAKGTQGGTPITEDTFTTNGTTSGVYYLIEKGVFKQKINPTTGQTVRYNFVYNSSEDKWAYNGSWVDLVDYGIRPVNQKVKYDTDPWRALQDGDIIAVTVTWASKFSNSHSLSFAKSAMNMEETIANMTVVAHTVDTSSSTTPGTATVSKYYDSNKNLCLNFGVPAGVKGDSTYTTFYIGTDGILYANKPENEGQIKFGYNGTTGELYVTITA